MSGSRTLHALLLAVAAGGFAPVSALGQALFYQGGFTYSWGLEPPRKSCDPDFSCGYASGGAQPFFTGGLSMVSAARGPLRLEAGAFVVYKGWEGIHAHQGLYADFPLLLRIGSWPDTAPFGIGINLGVAPALGFTSFDVDLAQFRGFDLQFRSRSGTRYRLSFSAEKGTRKYDSMLLHTVFITFGVGHERRRK
jgi:hypothetical protein